MSSQYPNRIAGLAALIGGAPVTTDWTRISQIETDVFAALTRDRAPMHNDPEWARGSPWGGTIVHGYHVLALLPAAMDALPVSLLDDDRNYTMNYGLNRVRILSPLRVGHRFRIHTEVRALDDRGDGRYLLTLGHSVEIEGEDRPFLVAEALAYIGVDQDLGASG